MNNIKSLSSIITAKNPIADELYSDSEIAKLLLLESQSPSVDSSLTNGRAVKTNKRFLKAVIRNVNDHNKQLERRPAGSSSLRSVIGDEVNDRYAIQNNRSNSPVRYRSFTLKAADDTSQRKSTSSSRAIKRHDGSTSNSREKRIRSEKLTRNIHEEPDYITISDDSDKRTEYTIDKKSRTSSRTTEQDGRHRQSAQVSNRSVEERKDKYNKTNQTHEPSTSKMDKYFSPTYDPRLDFQLEDITDPKTGLIQGEIYDDWESVLSQMKFKREAKAKIKEIELEKKLISAQRKLKKIEKKRRKEKKKLKYYKDLKRGKEDSDKDSDSESSSCQRSKQEIMKQSIKMKKKKRKTSKSISRKEDVDEEEIKTSERPNQKKRRRDTNSGSSSHSTDDDSSDSSSPHGTKKIGLMEFKGYSRRGQLREWDLGKPTPT